MEHIDLVDNEAPVNDAIIVEDREKLMLLHGGAVTKVTFDKVERSVKVPLQRKLH